ncbi:motility associated factor glycosyltransferase family protein [Brevibacillus fulvus]|uniref:6-hydroxymethylpterin diphosphokinase MptE-like domain-containing protein n=1 Tax=Brevibacillus fulvus TaxID=1125967 RepID=A0A938Y1B4_9BACL|nr:6-hydroxymethylpterin diphosphokinase MptE-like protein [Brevibacillus fulvus]MBM7591500.1 hypothetical protein [Brevibacillus fulvus]
MTYFQTNKQFLMEYNQWLCEFMEESIQTDSVECLRINDNILFKLQDQDESEFYTASIYDPEYEATQFLDGVNFDNTAYILMGVGSSAIIKQILKNKTEASWFFIIEKDTKLVKKLLEEIDFTPYLEGKLQRVVFITGDMEDVEKVILVYINSLVGYYFLQTDILRTFATFRIDREFYEEVTQLLINTIRTHMTSMGNSINDTLMGIRNELRNVPIALKSHRLQELKDAYKGKPIICVASGPSLDKQIPLLRQVKGKALIICAESALRVLLRNGITPDIVGILERGPNSYEISIQDLEIPEETALMGLMVMDERIPRAWNKHVVPVFKDNIAHSRILSKALGDMGTLYNGNSVAHLNFSIAHYFGGSPIVLIGQDLAFSEEGATHSKDSLYMLHADPQVLENERKQLQEGLREDVGFFDRTVYLDGYYGGKVRSKELWRQFLSWMEHLIAVLPTPLVINATEGGAYIRGAVNMPFQEVVEIYCQEPIVSIPELFSQLPPVSVESDLKERLVNMIDALNEELSIMEQVSQFAEEILRDAEQLQHELAVDAGKVFLLDMRAGRIMRNVEKLLKQVLKKPLLMFFFRPLLSNYHVKMNPISRVSSVERLQLILTHQTYFLKRLIEAKKEVFEVYEDGVRFAVTELGFDPDELSLNVQPKWEVLDEEEDEQMEEAY